VPSHPRPSMSFSSHLIDLEVLHLLLSILQGRIHKKFLLVRLFFMTVLKQLFFVTNRCIVQLHCCCYLMIRNDKTFGKHVTKYILDDFICLDLFYTELLLRVIHSIPLRFHQFFLQLFYWWLTSIEFSAFDQHDQHLLAEYVSCSIRVER
jgi:hypothetical protein